MRMFPRFLQRSQYTNVDIQGPNSADGYPTLLGIRQPAANQFTLIVTSPKSEFISN